ncbi:MAG: alpha-glucan family phosphorylase [Dehalococcoidia bacterium]|nr:alpha-glucan family phosphorylase [Dehalococcoidia bacterium]
MLPEPIGRLEELANNLWWSWHPQARDLFRALDYPLWRTSGHNPVKQLHDISPDKLQAAAEDPAFVKLYDSVMSAFDADMSGGDTWFAINHPDLSSGPIAYFSMEVAIHNSLPIYAGGLGILSGDVCKEASDLGIPLVGVGFMYPQGYFHQHVSVDGWQEEIYQQLNFDEAPVNPVLSPKGCRPLAQIQLADRTLYISAWQVQVGRVNIYLLCTDVEENAPQDRQLSARLYIADRELRIQQELVLGIGGVRVLRALGIQPVIWHANEGHTAFMMLERIREEVQKGITFAEAARKVQATTVFTTHTPVPAGNDVFPVQLVERYLHGYWESLGLSSEEFLQLGQDGSDEQTFNMTVLGLKMAEHRNAVSRLHGRVARKMWHVLWPEVAENNVPISHVTNGIHVPTWVAPELRHLYERYLGKDWGKRHDYARLWERVLDIPDDELWAVRQLLKRKLIAAILERAQKRWTEGGVAPQQVLAIGALLNLEVLTIGFVRRFTEYKRPALIFHDIERLKQIVSDQWRPVQIIFAGKSHPADFPSRSLLHQVYNLATDREFQGRIAFVEDYDMHMARYLVHGVDLWLNNPRRLQEACGTSGMKASLNGVPHLSIRDGWWHEGYNGANGWAIGDSSDSLSPDGEDKSDAEALYRLLEQEIVPLYYERDRRGVPHGWIRVVKEAIRSTAPIFCTRRMVKEYTTQMYIPVAQSLKEGKTKANE